MVENIQKSYLVLFTSTEVQRNKSKSSDKIYRFSKILANINEFDHKEDGNASLKKILQAAQNHPIDQNEIAF